MVRRIHTSEGTIVAEHTILTGFLAQLLAQQPIPLELADILTVLQKIKEMAPQAFQTCVPERKPPIFYCADLLALPGSEAVKAGIILVFLDRVYCATIYNGQTLLGHLLGRMDFRVSPNLMDILCQYPFPINSGNPTPLMALINYCRNQRQWQGHAAHFATLFSRGENPYLPTSNSENAEIPIDQLFQEYLFADQGPAPEWVVPPISSDVFGILVNSTRLYLESVPTLPDLCLRFGIIGSSEIHIGRFQKLITFLTEAFTVFQPTFFQELTDHPQIKTLTHDQ